MEPNEGHCQSTSYARLPQRAIRRQCHATSASRGGGCAGSLRRQGIAQLESVGAVILEADGTFSVIKDLPRNASALADIPELGGSNSANKEK